MQRGSLLICAPHRVHELGMPIEMVAQLGNVARLRRAYHGANLPQFVLRTGTPFLEIASE